MACWYVFSALGFYPVCPGVPEYVLATPSVKSAKIKLDNGNELKILSDGFSEKKVYAKNIIFNGKSLDTTYINHFDIKNGGELKFVASITPSEQEYTDHQLPFSLSRK